MEQAVETFEREGLKCTLFQDDSGCGDPRDASNLAVLYCWHPDYILGDEQFRDAEGRGSVNGRRNPNGGKWTPNPSNCHDTIEDAFSYIKRDCKATVVIPLFLYDHSGITMSTGAAVDKLSRGDVESRGRNPFDGAGWDTSWVGFAYSTEAKRKELGVKRSREEIEKQVRVEVEEYDKFLRGDVYGYAVTDSYGNHLDSCWGFLGYDYAIEEAKRALDWEVEAIIGRELNRDCRVTA